MSGADLDVDFFGIEDDAILYLHFKSLFTCIMQV